MRYYSIVRRRFPPSKSCSQSKFERRPIFRPFTVEDVTLRILFRQEDQSSLFGVLRQFKRKMRCVGCLCVTMVISVLLLFNSATTEADLIDSNSVANNKSIPLILHFMYFDEDTVDNRTFTRGELPLRDIVVDIVNKNYSVLPHYHVEIEMHMTRYRMSRNIGPTIETFFEHIIGSGSKANESDEQRDGDNVELEPLSSACSTYNEAYANVWRNLSADLFVCKKTMSPQPITPRRPPVPLFFGPEVSDEAKVIGQLTPLYNLVTISSQAASADLNNHDKYPNFFRTIASGEAYVNIPRALLAYLNYTTVGLVHTDGALFADTMQAVESDLRAHQFQVLYNEVYMPGNNDSTHEFGKNAQLYDARVFVVFSNDYSEYRMFCNAIGRFGANVFTAENYFFIFLMQNDYDIPVLVPRSIYVPGCTQNMLDRLLNGSLVAMSTTWDPNPKPAPTDMGLTIPELRDQILKLSQTDKYGDVNVTMADTDDNNANTADAFWTGLLALDALDKRLRAEVPNPRSLLNFTFKSADICAMLKEEVKKVRFRGATGDVKFSQEGRLQMDIPINQYIAGGRSTPYAQRFTYIQETGQMAMISLPTFATRNGQPPPDRKPAPAPYDEAAARRQLITIISIAVSAVVFTCVVVFVAVYVYQKRTLAKSLANPSWLFQRQQLTLRGLSKSQSSLLGGSHLGGGHSSYSLNSRRDSQWTTDVPTFPTALLNDGDMLVRLQQVSVAAARLQVNEKNHKVLTGFRDDLLHVNVVRFIGYCLYNAKGLNGGVVFEQYLLWEHCEKGSLEELIDNIAFKLDSAFRYALLLDVAQGMAFLHHSKPASIIGHAHGRLTPAACLIDRRFSVKIADYGEKVLAALFGVRDMRHNSVISIYAEDAHETVTNEKRLYWAPEVLRQKAAVPQFSLQSDFYAFAMTMYALITRLPPFECETETLSVREILELIRTPLQPPTRPMLSAEHSSHEIDIRLIELMQRCWAELPSERPVFSDIVQQLRTMSRVKGTRGNNNVSLTDQLLGRLEQYASNMESLVAARTEELESEKRRADELLNRMLPPEIVVELEKNGQVQPESFDSVTIYFSDIVGFTTISSTSSPIDIVNLLNALYTMFDAKIDSFDAYKVETIGDAYMVVSGLPRRNGSQHAAEIARLSLALLEGIKTFIIPHRPSERLMLRIGLHTGPCVAGVVGIKMPRYCLFGDTVNTASRMESNGAALRIHISHSMKLALDALGGFHTEVRGVLEIKGKGTMETHWLIAGENDEI